MWIWSVAFLLITFFFKDRVSLYRPSLELTEILSTCLCLWNAGMCLHTWQFSYLFCPIYFYGIYVLIFVLLETELWALSLLGQVFYHYILSPLYFSSLTKLIFLTTNYRY